MASRETNGPLASQLGWGATILLVLGVLFHRGSSPGDTKKVADRKDSQSGGYAARAADGPSSDAKSEGAGTGGVELSLHYRPKRIDKPPRYLGPIAQFVGKSPEEFCEGPASDIGGDEETTAPPDALSWVRRWGPQFAAYDPTFLIAALPDPDRSRSGYRFDLWLEALQRAAAAQDMTNSENIFVLDHYYLPWKRSGDDDAADAHDPDKYPGVLVFRSIAPDTRPRVRVLVVFLIGDTPTGGVSKRALSACLDIVAWFKIRGRAPNDNIPLSLRIVGPVFSGSQHSLQTGLQEWWVSRAGLLADNHWTWWINCVGTGTALTPNRFIPSHKLTNGRPFLDPPPGQVELRTTCLPDEVLEYALFQHLIKLHGGRAPITIAHLRESTTGYGASLEDPLRNWMANSDLGGARIQIIDVPFPLHISRVHARQEEAYRENEKSVPQFHAFDKSLRIPTDEVDGTADLVPEQSELMTGVYQDLVLTATIKAIARSAVPYIMISATDPRDRVFLASVISKHCPESRILLITGDQLYTHPDYARFLAGSYVASSYPLFPQVLNPNEKVRLHRGERHLPAFGEQQVFSYYNAVVAQLDKPGALLYYGAPRAGANECQPAIWISQIGLQRAHVLSHDVASPNIPAIQRAIESTIWRPKCEEAKRSHISHPQMSLPGPRLWWAVWLWGCNAVLGASLFLTGKKMALIVRVPLRRVRMLLVVHAFVMICTIALVGYILGNFCAGLVPDPDFPDSPAASQSWVALLGICIAFVLGSVLVARDIGFIVRWHRHYRRRSTLRMGRAGVSWLPGRFLRLHRWRRHRRCTCFWWFASLAVSLVIGIGAFQIAFANQSRWSVARIRDVRDGTSPFVPFCLLLAVPLCWSLLHWKRVEWLDRFDREWDPLSTTYPPRPPVVPPPTEWIQDRVAYLRSDNAAVYHACENWLPWRLPDDDRSAENATGRALFRFGGLRWNWYLFAGAAIVLYGQAVICERWLPGIDSGVVSFARFGFFVCGILIACEAGRLWLIWTALQRMHNAVARLPMQHAFVGLPEPLIKSYGDLFFVDRYRTGTARAAEHHYRQALAERRRLNLPTPWDTPDQFGRVQKQPRASAHKASEVRQYCRYIIADLQKIWERRPVNAAYGRTEVAKVGSHADTVIAATDTAGADDGQLAPTCRTEEEKLYLSEERLFATIVVIYLSQYRLQLKSSTLFLVAAPILLVLASASYPFQPQASLMATTGWLTMLSLVLLAVIVIRMNQDEFLSRITGTARRWYGVSADSITTLVLVFLPLLLVLASQLPGGEVLYGWIMPLLENVSAR